MYILLAANVSSAIATLVMYSLSKGHEIIQRVPVSIATGEMITALQHARLKSIIPQSIIDKYGKESAKILFNAIITTEYDGMPEFFSVIKPTYLAEMASACLNPLLMLNVFTGLVRFMATEPL